MKYGLITIMLAGLVGTGQALACEYKAGETEFLEYAHCLYGTEQVVSVALPDDSSWENCIYRVQAFMPPKLLAVTRLKDGREEASINCRNAIGNPCYLMKSACDAAFRAQER